MTAQLLRQPVPSRATGPVSRASLSRRARSRHTPRTRSRGPSERHCSAPAARPPTGPAPPPAPFRPPPPPIPEGGLPPAGRGQVLTAGCGQVLTAGRGQVLAARVPPKPKAIQSMPTLANEMRQRLEQRMADPRLQDRDPQVPAFSPDSDGVPNNWKDRRVWGKECRKQLVLDNTTENFCMRWLWDFLALRPALDGSPMTDPAWPPHARNRRLDAI
jgi:hypothetical protein